MADKLSQSSERAFTAPVPGRAFRLFIWFGIVFQVMMMLGVLVISVLAAPYAKVPQETVLSTLFGVAEILIFPAVGALIFSRRPNHPVGWLFCLSQAGWAMNNFANAFGIYAMRARPDLLPTARWLVWFYTWPGYFSLALFLLLILLFPDGMLPSPRWNPVVWLVVGWSAVSIFASAFAPGLIDTSRVLVYNNPLGIGGSLGNMLVGINNASQVILAPLMGLVGLSLVLRFRSAQGIVRQQLKWLAGSIVLVVLMVVLAMILMVNFPIAAETPLWATALEELSIFSLTLIPITAGIAILRYRLYEIDRIINQALVYSSLTATLALVYFGSIILLQTVLSALTGEGQSSVATVLSTLAIAGLFVPLRRRIQNVIDRRFYRRRYNTEIILERFSGAMRQEVDLQRLSDQLVKVVEETFQPSQSVLWIKKGK